MGSFDAKHRSISHNGEPFGADPIDALLDEGPIDVAAVRRDDALIDAIAGDGPIATDSVEEYQLATLLAAWRAEVDSTPMPADPDLDTVVAAVNQEIAVVAAIRRRKRRFVGPTAAAAAVVAVVAGITAISYNASPGDALWSVKEAVFSKQAESTMALMDSSTDMDAAEQAFAQGDVDGATLLLERASNRASSVDNAAHREDLRARVEALRTRLDRADSAAPSALPTMTGFPILPVPPWLLLPTSVLAPSPPETNQLVPDAPITTTAAIPPEEVPLLVPPTELPLTVEPEPTHPVTVEPGPTQPQLPGETTDLIPVHPSGGDTQTQVPPSADLAPPAEPSPLTTARAEPELPPIPSGGFPGGIDPTPGGGPLNGIEPMPSLAPILPLGPGGF